VNPPTINLSFPHCWQAELLAARPFILPSRHFVYPVEAEEVERGALEVIIRPEASSWRPFLATCAVGFSDPAVPTGLWSVPNPDELCAVSGGYAYVIDVNEPERFSMIPYRPVLTVHSVPSHGLILFTGHHGILAWGTNGEAWQSGRLSSEGVTINAIEGNLLHGLGWDMMTDKETPFALDLRTGLLVPTTGS
jgi:hypothetical protein